jgi:hypothetical protein
MQGGNILTSECGTDKDQVGSCYWRRNSRCRTGLRLMYAQHVETDGKDLFAEICRLDLEGVVAKRGSAFIKTMAMVG